MKLCPHLLELQCLRAMRGRDESLDGTNHASLDVPLADLGGWIFVFAKLLQAEKGRASMAVDLVFEDIVRAAESLFADFVNLGPWPVAGISELVDRRVHAKLFDPGK